MSDDGATADTGPAAEAEDESDRLLPLFREWFEEQGVPLPLPLGAGVMMIFMERDIEVREVTVQFLEDRFHGRVERTEGGGPPELEGMEIDGELLVQGEGRSREELSSHFRNSPSSVISRM